MIGKICFLSPSSGRNKRIRQLFQAEITSLPYIVSHWNDLYDNIPWKKVWTLSSKYLITNKVQEVSYKLLRLFYPVKLYMKKMFPDINYLCSFCEAEDESMSHLFWEFTYTNLFWKDFFIFVHAFSSQSFFLLYKDVLFGCHNVTKEDDNIFSDKLSFFLQNSFCTNVNFKVLSPSFLFSVRTLNLTWILFLHPTIPKPSKRSHCVI